MKQDFLLRVSNYGDGQGKAWLDSLPALLKEFSEKWSIKIDEPFQLSYNYVAPAFMTDGQPVVIKIGFPGDKEYLEGIKALEFYNGRGVVKLLRADFEQKVTLLERLVPGQSLLSIQDNRQATMIAAELLQKLWQPVTDNSGFSELNLWAKGFDRFQNQFSVTSSPLPYQMVKKAQIIFNEALQSMTEKVLLHGDFHFENILTAEREPWLAIDPKGIIGEPAYDTVTLLRNPVSLLKNSEAKRILAERIDILAEVLRLDKQRIKNWGFAQAVLSAIWSVEDQEQTWQEGIDFAKILETI